MITCIAEGPKSENKTKVLEVGQLVFDANTFFKPVSRIRRKTEENKVQTDLSIILNKLSTARRPVKGAVKTVGFEDTSFAKQDSKE
jgi:hypothetical protein